MELQAFDHQGNADHHQEAECQDFGRGMPTDELTDGSGGQEHDDYREDDRSIHHPQFLYHTHGGDDGIDGEHQVQQNDFRQHTPETDLTGGTRGD